jgi:hypothetical protein
MIRVNASRGGKGLGMDHNSLPDLRIKKQEIHTHKRLNERVRPKNGLASDFEGLDALEPKECMLEIQAMILRQLAADENCLKGFSSAARLTVVEFQSRVKEVEEALRMLKL